MVRQLVLLLLGLLFYQAHAYVVTDDAHELVILKTPAKRIISLAPDLTEILFAIGAAPQIIGVVQGSDYPDAAKKIPVVARFDSLDVESIVALHPDLIVAWAGGMSPAKIHQLKSLHVPIYLSAQHFLKDIPVTMQRLGDLTGHEKKAKAIAEAFTREYKNLQQTYSHRSPMTVFYELGNHPLMTVTKRSWINEAITVCGGKNIFADLPGVALAVDREAVMVANPEVIVGNVTKQEWKNKPNVFSIHPDWIERAGPRILLGVKEMCVCINQARKSL